MIWVKFAICLSTTFGQPGDGYGGTTNALHLKRPVNATDMGIAHRTLPMGTRVRITNLRTGLSAIGITLDTGPWGMRDEKGWFNSRKGGKWTPRALKRIKRLGEKAFLGCADLTPAMGRAVRHDGRDRIKLEVLR